MVWPSPLDTYNGHFGKLIPNKQVVEVEEFETENPALQGKMTITVRRTRLCHDNVPPGVSPADNETGWRMALDKLATLVEAGTTGK